MMASPSTRSLMTKMTASTSVPKSMQATYEAITAPETAQQRELLRPEPGDIDKGLGPGQHREQRQQQHLVERIHHLAALARVRQIVKIAQKNRCFSKGPTIRRRGVHPRTPPSNQMGLDGFRPSRLCHPLLRPIALEISANHLAIHRNTSM